VSDLAGITAAPVVDQASEPAWVRQGSPATKRAYQEALAFESVLVEELAGSLGNGGLGGSEAGEGAGGEAGEGSTSGEAGLSAMAPQALSGAIMGDGGLGLAAQLARGLVSPQTSEEAASAGTAAAVGGTAAASGGTSTAVGGTEVASGGGAAAVGG
jgi:hypothetical protein